jgi:hypothetical protein
MGCYKSCLHNKEASGNGYGKCFVGPITPVAVERSAYLQEQKTLGILPSFYDCIGPSCKYPTRPKNFQKLAKTRLDAWRKKIESYKEND